MEVSKIVDGYKIDKLLTMKADGIQITDFLPEITNADMPIMKSWKKHFRDRKVPFAITQNGGVYKLWKKEEGRHEKDFYKSLYRQRKKKKAVN